MKRAALAVSAAAVTLSIAAVALFAFVPLRGATETLAASDAKPGSDARFADVDWDALERECPGAVGWIQVSGTDISLPVCAATRDDPDYYLTHAADGTGDAWGCPYLSWFCEGGLTGSGNAVVSGHHMNDGSMFSPLADATDPGWIEGHREAYVQTREHRCVYEIVAADRIDASAEGPGAGFTTQDGLDRYMSACVGGAEATCGELDSDRMLTLVTCSYGIWANQRTVLYAKPVEADGKKGADSVSAALGETDVQEREREARQAAYMEAQSRYRSLSANQEPSSAMSASSMSRAETS